MPRAALQQAQCDQSGLCEEIEEIGVSERLIYLSTVSALVVDAAPLVHCHSLLITRAHIPRTCLLPEHDFLALGKLVEESSEIVRKAAPGQVLVVEHGSGDAATPFDCVRHAHIHLVPCKSDAQESDIEVLVDRYLQVESYLNPRGWGSLYGLLREMTDYLVLSTDAGIWIGRPKRAIRHCSRALISALLGTNPDLADWAIGAKAGLYKDSVPHLRNAAARDG
jgi:diadenosine tetraphosphate (Ap4A) HIT family hydrolase